ncbi:NAD-dependent epimerase [Sinorhizobium meliloti]|jgi:UDP-glucuronate 4-epimerase|uniref:Probable UDP-glucuronate 4-epimerase n=5 Tax=Rhizobium meliloti TaxID=382 RepID=LPSL_RHIME|nr:NAD-dependent epimerase [Sinorhizobium meliloti]O54067.2 RecName: Full=Probable UDP-glucuronate 4-epimerase; AltName: Full=UDP-glucuronic acid epimerase [Sinorhizobium meliloti 1021]PST27761.1 UDP-glucuronate 5'-epimerase [Mesorhizobium loti]TWB02681.1 UDP-glucuronate 4-epimerase [Ensifer sp. SEMIA 134]TWB36631.1 UDP-glucuronate 4-epimerase [Ensifer sp. SEMIA 135]AEG03640.1 UDP-glucuronate 5'-epimerase [Sinorhizobium meliloti BL225C]AEG52632.1 UDP-glucuronate 5'-epimerase [Sinorhizobium me
MRYLITGTAGFIGFHVAKRLIDEGHFVVGFDGMTPYYDVTLKERRHAILQRSNGFKAVTAMLEDRAALDRAAELAEPEVIIHLAAQAGVRYSLENPKAYVDANLVGSWNMLELAKAIAPKHLMLASTSSIYGANEKIPFAEADRADEPMTLYAATKKSMELMAHSYAHLYKVPTTSFRFFTVYGPWGRPDMALFKFVDAIHNGRPIDIYGEGRMSRDFTYIDDLVESIVRLSHVPPSEENRVAPEKATDTLSRHAPFRVVNTGGGQPVELMTFVETVEKAVGRPAIHNMLPMQQGDVPRTFASPDLLEALTGFKPSVSVEEGVARFVEWYDQNYRRAHTTV